MMGAWQIDPTKSADWTAEERAAVKQATAIYKSWIRPMLSDVKVHHILPRPDGYHWDGMFYWSPGLKRGTLYIFRPNNDQAEQKVRLKGLEAGVRYRVWSQDGSVVEETRTGEGLMRDGVRVKLGGKFSSDLVFVEWEGDSLGVHKSVNAARTSACATAEAADITVNENSTAGLFRWLRLLPGSRG